MERQEVSEAGSVGVGGVNLDLPELGDGQKAPEATDQGGTTSQAGSKYTERQRQQRREAKKRYYEKNKAAINAKTVQYRRDNPERVQPTVLAWRERTKERRAVYMKKWQDDNREARNNYAKARNKKRTPEQQSAYLAGQKAYREQNRGTIAAQIKKWRAENPDRIKEINRSYLPRRLELSKERRRDPIQRLKDACRTRVGFILRKAGIPKFNHTFELVGCTPDFFKSHIESQWESWMNWDNYGDWEIDHIKPLASFDLAVKEELLAAFHYSNCQPLEKIDNRIKNAKIMPSSPPPSDHQRTLSES